MLESTVNANRQIITFGILMSINFPLYLLVWHHETPHSYHNIALRIMATILCLGLAFKNYWPEKLKPALPVYWYFVVFFTLPFFFVFMTLKNGAAILWLMNVMSALFFLLLLLDFLSALVLLILGTLSALLYFTLTTHGFQFTPGTLNMGGVFSTFLAAIVIGGLFARNKEYRIQAQKKFLTLANQVAHDIRSPLSSLLMIVKSCSEIPEQDRIALREAAISIGDIANNLLNQYRNKDSVVEGAEEEQETSRPMLVSAVLLELLTEKKYEYHDLPIKFDYDLSEASFFAFIKLPFTAFKRMISNITNNAVDAFQGGDGRIVLSLSADNEWVTITVEDNGLGMPKDVADKIMNNVAVTSGKEKGHGIGLTQVRETLQQYQGELKIESEEGKGTKIHLTFPRIRAPKWIAEIIELNSNDIVLILDDDSSIHRAWDARFEDVLKIHGSLQLKHFTHANELLECVQAMDEAAKSHVFLLTDYELLKQNQTGLDVVATTQLPRSILVTSHYANKDVLEQAAKTNTQILPKHLASEIAIHVQETTQMDKATDKSVDVILVDDDAAFIETLANFIFSDFKVEKYHNPVHFLEQVDLYPKDIKIYVDCNFDTTTMSGIEVAKSLHEKGFKRLYLLSGQYFSAGELPEYVTHLQKTDLEAIKQSTKA